MKQLFSNLFHIFTAFLGVLKSRRGWMLACFMLSCFAHAQTADNPAVWTHQVIQHSDTEYQLVFTGKIQDGWHLYSQYTAEGGSLPSQFTFDKAGEDYALIGVTTESETHTAYSDIFEMEETFFKNQAIFTQNIKRLNPNVRQLSVTLFYQICKEICIPKEEVFQISLDGTPFVSTSQTIDERSATLSAALQLDIKNKSRLYEHEEQVRNSKSNLWMIFGLGFLGGLLALLTPCVFPMIPLTVSFFAKRAKHKAKGLHQPTLYGLCIVLIYVLLSLPFHLFGSVDAQILNTLATNMWLNVGFFIVFVFFAFSFFGYYELTLPGAWATRLDATASKVGGGIGVFFMALTLAIVSFSCTGPILGGLLGATTLAEGDVATNLSAGMVGFGLALALPFTLFAFFPAWLHALPRSGRWMNTVKVVLGFLELALAFKFLSNADLVGHWGLLKREIFLGIWILLFVLLALYLFGTFRFPHDTAQSKVTLAQKFMGIISLAFSVYLSLGLLNYIPLKLLSGFPPPDFYSVQQTENDCPLGLSCFKDFEMGLAHSRAVNKPILLDFTGWACVNCRKMEEHVWSDPRVYSLLREKYVLISLYVDDRKSLPESQRFDFKYDNGRVKTITTIGEKWGTFQTVNFRAASQPYYILLSPDLEVLAAPVQYVDADTYAQWLRMGLERWDINVKR